MYLRVLGKDLTNDGERVDINLSQEDISFESLDMYQKSHYMRYFMNWSNIRLAISDNCLIKNVVLVYAVSLIQFIFSLVTNLVVPMVAGKVDFANYRMLTLYANYAGFFHFGLLNGLYLYTVGKQIEALNWRLVSDIKRVLLILQVVIIPLALFVLPRLLPENVDRVVIIAAIVSWGMANFITFYNYLVQGTGQFHVFAAINIVSQIVGIILVIYFVLTQTAVTRNLIVVFMLPLAFTWITYEFYWNYIKPKIQNAVPVQESLGFMRQWKRGIVLYLANICISLLFSLGNLLASLLFSVIDFAHYSFVFGLSSIVHLGTDGLTTALIPYIARSHITDNRDKTSQIAYAALIWLSPLAFWVFSAMVKGFYTQYTESLPLLVYFFAALPFGILIRSRIVAVATAVGKESVLLRFALRGLITVTLFTAFSYLFNPTPVGLGSGWSVAIALTGMLGGISTMRRLSISGKLNDLWLVYNALVATVLFFLCAIQEGMFVFSMLYALGAVGACYINWKYIQG